MAGQADDRASAGTVVRLPLNERQQTALQLPLTTLGA